MAPGKAAVDFNNIINADRQRRKNEALANEIFGKNRRSSAPGAGVHNRKPGSGPSLASRVGVTKRTVSTSARPPPRAATARPSGRPDAGDVDAEWTHDLHALNNPSASRVSQPPHGNARPARTNRSERLYSALNGSGASPAASSQFNIVPAKKPAAQQLSIRGLAGPYVVMAKNFARGTTVADIESAMTPVGGVMLDCRLVTERPSVIAEITFETKEGADNVVDTFNNQNADGNILHVYHKPTTPAAPKPALQPPPQSQPTIPTAPRGTTDRYTPRPHRRRDDVTDGSFGFADDDRMDTDEPRGLYSDTLVETRGRGRDRRGYR